MKRNRIQWVDVARGLAIILVVLGHCIGNMDEPGNRFILAFHMPLFFFLSGLCCKWRGDSFDIFLKKKIRTLLIPQIIFGTINCSYEMIFRGGKTSLSDWFLGWFLLVLFYVSVLFFILQHRFNIKSWRFRCMVIIVDLIAINIVEVSGITTKLHFEIIPMAFLFYSLGNFCGLIDVEKLYNYNGLWLLSIPVVVICSYWNNPIAMYLNSYGNLFIFFVGAISGIIMMCGFACNFQNNRILAWFGRNSIIIYIVHFKMIDIVHSVGRRALPEISMLMNIYPVYWCYFVIVILLLFPIIYICEQLFRLFFEKNKSGECH